MFLTSVKNFSYLGAIASKEKVSPCARQSSYLISPSKHFLAALTKSSKVLHLYPVTPSMLHSANAPQSVVIIGVPESKFSICTPPNGSTYIDAKNDAFAPFINSALFSKPAYPTNST